MSETQGLSKKLVTLEEFIIEAQSRYPQATGELTQLLMDITLASKIIAREINHSVIKDINSQDRLAEPLSFRMARLEQFAKEQMYYALNRSGHVCMMISDDSTDVERLNTRDGKYIVVIDPLDGTANIEFNAAVATTFSILRRRSEAGTHAESWEALQAGSRQVVGGYVLYGSSIMLVFTAEGLGVNFFTMDPAIGEFFLSVGDVKVPDFKGNFSINTGFYELWDPADKAFYDFIINPEADNRGPFSLRYGGSMVSDVHRILMEGGIFAYPANKVHPDGKLHMMYKCNPLAFIMEQAGGVATNGRQRLLDVQPMYIHQRTPVYLGSAGNMAQLEDIHNKGG
jgi:fructose-1,6-bisphosphatase I